MDFFKQLTEASPNVDLSLRMMRASKDGKITIHLIPGNYEVKHLELIGTPEELDAEFFNVICKPLAVVNGIQTNADDFVAAVNKGLDKAQESNPEAQEKPAVAPPKTPEKKAAVAKKAPEKKPKVKEESKDGTEFPWPAGSKVIVTAPGKYRAKEGLVDDVTVSDGQVLVAFNNESVWVPVKDLALAKKAEDAAASKTVAQTCRICGCTQEDCSQCIEKTGHPCHWVEKDLCSRCSDEMKATSAEVQAQLEGTPTPDALRAVYETHKELIDKSPLLGRIYYARVDELATKKEVAPNVARPTPPKPTPPKPPTPASSPALFPDDRGGTGHGDISHSDADQGL